MASLVSCTACQRHIRRAEAECPFCGAQRTPSAGPFREVVIPRDIKRATILAIGLTLAGQACGGQSEGDNDPVPSGAGASIGTSTGGTGGNATGGTGGSAGDFGGGTGFGMPQPPYGGIPFPPPDPNTGGSAGSTGMPQPQQDAGTDADNGSDAAPEDAGD